MFLDQVIHFGKNFADQVKDRSPKNLRLLIEVPYVAHLKIQVLIFNINICDSTCEKGPLRGGY